MAIDWKGMFLVSRQGEAERKKIEEEVKKAQQEQQPFGETTPFAEMIARKKAEVENAIGQSFADKWKQAQALRSAPQIMEEPTSLTEKTGALQDILNVEQPQPTYKELVQEAVPQIQEQQGLAEQNVKRDFEKEYNFPYETPYYKGMGMQLLETKRKRVPFNEQDITITPELEGLSGNILKSGQVRKGFEVNEAFKQNREKMTNKLKEGMFEFRNQIRLLPPQNLIDDVSNIDSSIKSLDEIERMANDALSQNLLPVGRIQGYLTEAKQFVGALSEDEAKMRTLIKNQNAITLRNLGGTALTKTEKETFEESLPLLTVSPTEFFARLGEIRNSLIRKGISLEETSARFGRPIASKEYQPEVQKPRPFKDQFNEKKSKKETRKAKLEDF